MTQVVPVSVRVATVSVVIPTIGRPEKLCACLKSLSECEPRAAEILVVDQSGEWPTASVVERFAEVGARMIPCDGRGVSRAMNLGLREASNDIVLVTHDDCAVAPSWVGRGSSLMAYYPGAIVTGRVLPVSEAKHVPSTRDDPFPHDYTGKIHPGALFPNNMALNRSAVQEMGGFDERFETTAEDLDLCYRWLRAGRALRYEPGLVAWHGDWRTGAQLEDVYRGYWRGLGAFYAKHLHHVDLVVMRLLALSLFGAFRGTVARAVKGRAEVPSCPPGFVRAFVSGLVGGWKSFSHG